MPSGPTNLFGFKWVSSLTLLIVNLGDLVVEHKLFAVNLEIPFLFIQCPIDVLPQLFELSFRNWVIIHASHF